MNTMAKDYYKQGYSCSESIIKFAIDKGYVSSELLPVATAFSGGMSSGCLCGAVAGSQIVIGCLYGKDEKGSDGQKARELAKKFIDDFKTKNKVTCCKALTAGLEFASPERKANCTRLVGECEEILDSIVETAKEAVL